MKRRLLLGRKVMTNLDSIFKSRDMDRLVKAMVFPMVMYGCESWTIKKAEHLTDAFELWYWRRLLRVPWTVRRSNWKDLCWSWNSNTLATWCKALTHLKRPWGCKDWGQEEKGTTEDEMIGWHHWLSGHGFGWTLGVGDRQGGLVCCSSQGRKESDTNERLNWTEQWKQMKR